MCYVLLVVILAWLVGVIRPACFLWSSLKKQLVSLARNFTVNISGDPTSTRLRLDLKLSVDRVESLLI